MAYMFDLRYSTKLLESINTSAEVIPKLSNRLFSNAQNFSSNSVFIFGIISGMN